jgi:alanine racemase
MSQRSPGPPHANGPSEAEAGGVLTIDLSAIVANWRLLGARAASAECGAVVKADAYGCGIEPVVAALTAAGCRTLFVAHIEEGRRARRTAPQADVYLLIC